MRILPIGDIVAELNMFSIVQPEPGLFEGVADGEGVFGCVLHHLFAGVFGVLPARSRGCGECTGGGGEGCPESQAEARAEEGEEGGHCGFAPAQLRLVGGCTGDAGDGVWGGGVAVVSALGPMPRRNFLKSWRGFMELEIQQL